MHYLDDGSGAEGGVDDEDPTEDVGVVVRQVLRGTQGVGRGEVRSCGCGAGAVVWGVQWV